MNYKNIKWVRYVIESVLITVVGQMIGLKLFGQMIEDEYILSVFAFTPVVLLIICLIKFIYKKPAISIGLVKKKIFREYFLGICIGLFVFGIEMVIQLFKGELIMELNPDFSVKVIVFIGIGYVFQTMAEELTDRGFLQNFVENDINIFFAMVVQSIVFSILHFFAIEDFNFTSFFMLALMGLFFGSLLYYRKNIWIASGAHFAWNFSIMFFGNDESGFGLFVSENIDINSYSEIRQIIISIIAIFIVFALSIKRNKRIS